MRITMNLAMILTIPFRILLVIGAEKEAVLSAAPGTDLPITRLLQHDGTQIITESKPLAEINTVVADVIATVEKRSAVTRRNYLDGVAMMEADPDSNRGMLGCSNLAHAAAGALDDQADLLDGRKPHIGIITAYNDMLSAHQPYEHFPAILKAAIRQAGGTAQVAAGVPAMCDGVTQARPGMELSLASRDVIAMSTAVGLSHGVYDAALCLGVCDKIVPGQVIGALSHGHIPVIMVPAGPMSSGCPMLKKQHSVRRLHVVK